MAHIEVGLAGDGIGRVVLNRPEKRNALSRAMCLDIAAGVRRLGNDPGCTGIILSANGATFSAGADMSEAPHELAATWHWDDSETVAMYRSIAESPVPVIAAVEALTVGLGVGLLAQSTFVVASEAASFWFPEVRQGFFPYGVVQCLARRVAPESVVRWALSAERVSAAEARAERLVTDLVPEGEALTAAFELLRGLTVPGRTLVAEALRFLRFSQTTQSAANVDAWCSERMTADVLKRRGAESTTR